MNVRELALAAHAKRQAEREAAEAARREEEQRYLAERQLQVRALIERSPLDEWFPGAEWDIMDAADAVVSPADRSVYLMLASRDDGSVRVQAVQRHSSTDMPGYPYWSGPEVLSAADVGEFLLASGG